MRWLFWRTHSDLCPDPVQREADPDESLALSATAQTAYLRDDRLVPPRRVADDVPERLLAAILNHGGHRGECGRFRLRKPMPVALGHRRVVVPAAAEEWAVKQARSGKTTTPEPGLVQFQLEKQRDCAAPSRRSV